MEICVKMRIAEARSITTNESLRIKLLEILTRVGGMIEKSSLDGLIKFTSKKNYFLQVSDIFSRVGNRKINNFLGRDYSICKTF